jgi:hypothetical protein
VNPTTAVALCFENEDTETEVVEGVRGVHARCAGADDYDIVSRIGLRGSRGE